MFRHFAGKVLHAKYLRCVMAADIGIEAVGADKVKKMPRCFARDNCVKIHRRQGRN